MAETEKTKKDEAVAPKGAEAAPRVRTKRGSAKAEAGPHGVRQFAGLAAFAHARTNGVDHVARLQIAAPGDHRAAHITVADFRAFLLDARPALAPDRARDTRSEDQL